MSFASALEALMHRLDPLSVLVGLTPPICLFVWRTVKKPIRKGVRYVIEGVLYLSTRVLKQRIAGALTLRRFCQIQISRYQFLHVPSSIDVQLPLDDVFVTLQLESQGSRSTASQADLLKVANRLIVVGDPGSGKSSLVKWLFRNACREARAMFGPTRLPVLIELKNLEVPKTIRRGDRGKWLLKELRRGVSEVPVYKIGECFDAYSRKGGLLLLLDGLDEVSTPQYPLIEDALCSLSEELALAGEDNVIVLTMRGQFYQQVKDAYRDSFGPTMWVNPFSPSDIYEFLTRWPIGEGPENSVARIYKALTERPTLREMCRNPLVLSMYVAQAHGSETTVAPENRTDFYRRVSEELIIRRRQVQKQGTVLAPAKLRQQRQRILGRLALEHLLDPEQPANLLSWARALEVVDEVVACGADRSEDVLRALATETGIIAEERPGESFRFIHLTFCEFLAAFEASQEQRDGWRQLVDAHRAFQATGERQMAARLVEVIPFACGLLRPAEQGSALSDVAELDDSRLLARGFLETKLYEHESWSSFVQREEAALMGTPEDAWDEQWLERLYLFNVVVLDAFQSSEHSERIKKPVDFRVFFQRLVDTQVESLGKLLSAYASYDAAAAFGLAEVSGIDLPRQFPEVVIRSCDQEPFFRMVVDRIISGDQRDAIWIDLLSEAALRSRAVATMMFGMPGAAVLSVAESRLERRLRWPHLIARDSFLAQCLTVSLGQESIYDSPILRVFRKLKRPPRPCNHWQLKAFRVGLPAGAYLAVNIYIFERIAARGLPIVPIIRASVTKIDFMTALRMTLTFYGKELAVLFAVYMLLFAFSGAVADLRRLYAAMLNIDEHPGVQRGFADVLVLRGLFFGSRRRQLAELFSIKAQLGEMGTAEAILTDKAALGSR